MEAVKPPARRYPSRGGLELVEEAVQLLRVAPGTVLASYYLGALPFVLGWLYFWTDMSRGPFAHQRLAGGALGLAALFFWMKFWQAVFARQLRVLLGAASASPLSWRRGWHMLTLQTFLHAFGLFVLPLALVLTIPFAWVYAFFQNLTVLAEDESGRLRPLIQRAAKQAVLWPKQNHWVILILFGFGCCVFLNWATVGFALPYMVKVLTGVESVFTRSSLSLLNTTFFAGVFSLTYLCVDPILKAAYALRCFYGEAVHSGEDLRAELRQLSPALPRAAMILLVAFVLPACGRETGPVGSVEAGAVAWAAAQAPAQPGVAGRGGVSTEELDRSIQEVVRQRKYTWRMPRERVVEESDSNGILARFWERVGELLKRGAEALGNWLGRWLRKLFGGPSTPLPKPSGYGWIVAQQILLFVLIAAAAGGLAFLVYRLWRDRQPRAGAIAATPMTPAPNLADESLGADQLPEDGWTRLARELLARGELRLALRAFYLASLAHLAERNLITLARFKSNRDYACELERRAHAFPEVFALFGENVSVFDRIWYGLHDLDAALVDRFAANVDRMRSHP